MASLSSKPVIFLAFANNQNDQTRYLRHLHAERAQIEQVLARACASGLCELLIEPQATVENILEIFQSREYRNRIAIFHFAGHANGYQLLLESSGSLPQLAYARGFAAFLSQQTGVRLVFLNGCSTGPQVEDLLLEGVPSVIATSSAIDDWVASMFASRFYRGLGLGASIRTAFNEAAAAIQMIKGGHPRDLCVEITDDRWPWTLYPQDVTSEAGQWNLPEASGNPVFGLPPLPESALPSKPFLHLNQFTREYAEVFFGRGHQVRHLYQMINDAESAPIIFLYGRSGVGKSSFLSAGLMPRLEAEHVIRYQRRSLDVGLLGSLASALGLSTSDQIISMAWQQLESQQNRPVTVLIDQAEEVYTRPIVDPVSEIAQFFGVLESLFNDLHRRPRGKLLLAFRKEWLAEIEAALAGTSLYHDKMLLERLDRTEAIEIITGLTRSERLKDCYRLVIDPDLAEVIADDLLRDEASPIAPTLQILLTRLWDAAYISSKDHVRFTHELYRHLKSEGMLLQDFLLKQLTTLRGYLPQEVDSGLALDVLSFHVTALGTAELRKPQTTRQEYSHVEDSVSRLIEKFKELYLLVDYIDDEPGSNVWTRLAHDTLTPLIRRELESSDLPGQRARRILESRAREWSDGAVGTTMDEVDLEIVERGRNGMRAWHADEVRLITASRERREQNRRERERARKVLYGSTVRLATKYFDQNEVGLVDDLLRSCEVDQRHWEWRWLYSQSHQELKTFTSQSIALLWCGLSPNATLVFASGMDGRIHAWDAESAQEVMTLEAHLGAVGCCALSADGTRLVSGEGRNYDIQIRSNDYFSPLKIWDTANGTKLHVLRGHPVHVSSCAFSPDMHWVVSGDEDGGLKLWNTQTGEEVLSFEGHTKAISSCSFNREGTYVISGGTDGIVRVWEVASGSLIRTLEGHNQPVTACAFAPYEDEVLSVSQDGTIKFWNIATGTLRLSIGSGSKPVMACTFSPDGKHVVAADSTRVLRIWDVGSGAELRRLRGHTGDVSACSFSHDGLRIISCGNDGTVKLWDATSQDVPHSITVEGGYLHASCLSQEGTDILTFNRDGKLTCWEVKPRNGSTPIAIDTAPYTVEGSFSADGRWLIAAAEGLKIALWETATGRCTGMLDISTLLDRNISDNGAVPARETSNGAPEHLKLKIDPNDLDMLEQSESDATKKEDMPSVDTRVQSCAVNTDGTIIAVCTSDRTVGVMEVATGQVLNSCRLNVFELSNCQFSPDGRFLVIVLNQEPMNVTHYGLGTSRLKEEFYGLCLLSTQTQGSAVTMKGHTGWINAVQFSPDGRQILSASSDCTLRQWNTETGEELAVLKGHAAPVQACAWSSDGKRVVSAGWDGTMRIWDVDTGTELTAVSASFDRISFCGFDPDGSTIFTVTWDGKISSWPTGRLIELAEFLDVVRNRSLDTVKVYTAVDPSLVQLCTENGDSALSIAVSGGRSEVLRHLVELGVDIQSKGRNGMTLLHLAAASGQLDTALVLLSYGADQNAVDDEGRIPLHLAAGEGFDKVVEVLLANQMLVDLRDSRGQTPLHNAASRAWTDEFDRTVAIEELSEMLQSMTRILPNERGQDDRAGEPRRAPQFPAGKAHTQVAELLLLAGADPNARDEEGLTVLHRAVFRDAKDIVDLCLAHGADIHIRANDGLQALHFAAAIGNTKIMERLIASGVSANVNDNESLLTPLHVATFNGKKESVTYLLSHGTSPEVRRQGGYTALHDAAEAGVLEIVEALLANGADVNASSDNSTTPLHLAAAREHVEVVRVLLEHGANVEARSDWGRSPLFMAMDNNTLDVPRLLLSFNASVNVHDHKGMTPLHFAAEKGRSEIVDLLLTKGADANAITPSSSTALHWAAARGVAKAVEVLLDKGARVDIRDADGATALHRAVEYGHIGIVDLLLANKADINARAMQGYTPLLIASVRGFPEIIDLLVTKGVDVEVINEDGLNALHVAILYTDSIQTVERLIAGGTDVNASTPEGSTPLHIAASQDKIEIVRLLLAARAEINARTEDGWTPLHEAITASEEVVELLLDNHADVNATSEYGYTPLHRAVAKGKREVVRQLLQEGADTSLVDENGLSAIDFALEAGHSDIADLLIEHEHLQSASVSEAPLSANQAKRTPGIVEDTSNIIPVASASAEHRFIEQQTCTCTGHWTIRLFSIIENADRSGRYILEKADVQCELCGQINMFYFQVDTYSPEYKNERLALFRDSDLLDLPVVGPWRDVNHLTRHAALTTPVTVEELFKD